MKKISVLMPSYNDADSIVETLDSLIIQTYENWELIIIDDGSTDDTKEVVGKYKKEKDIDDKIKYIYQENQDQLLAIINGLNYITGDYIYILHSDDLMCDSEVFKKAVYYLEKNPNVDSILGDLTIIDEFSNVTGMQKVLPYLNKKRIPAIQLLWLGRNLYVDMAFHRKEAFMDTVYRNYLVWDKPFWIDTFDEIKMLNVKKVDFSFFKYRIHPGNYANEDIGKLCLINGELRTATELMKFYNIPFYKIQYFFFRVFCHLNLFKVFYPIYQNKETKNKAEIVEYIINKRYPDGYNNNVFFKSLYFFYRNNTRRVIDFDKIYNGTDPIYLGNSFRIFNKQLLSNTLPTLYTKMFKEMEIGFNEIIVSEKNKEKAINLTKFLCIYPFVKVRSRKYEKKSK